MDKVEILHRLLCDGLIPVVRVASASEAVAVGAALQEGGVGVIEVTMSVPGALGVIRELAQRNPDGILIGAGTVLDPETGRAALLDGARFIVSPTLNLDLIRLCRRYGAVAVAGALTPTEILTAWEAGADLVKVFPVAQLGGPAYIRAVKAPLPQIPLVPTGGVDLGNVGDFIRAGAAALGVGGELVDRKAIAAGEFSAIAQSARKFLDAIRNARAQSP
jgi:2-dehydro-3-deoxyphosphogluconate aldolase/(4S)-4-hydroxy-2-oxoglutarate aldolase